MNGIILAAGCVAAFTTIGHFVIGEKQFLIPMLESNMDDVPKKIMHCLFHYVSAFLILSTFALTLVGAGIGLGGDATLLVRFIAANFIAFAIWQVGIAVESGIPKGMFKLFQWICCVIIATLAILGTL